jgi:hypothetical protein
MITRRGIIGGLIGIVAAPAIVRASALMPVKSIIYADAPKITFTETYYVVAETSSGGIWREVFRGEIDAEEFSIPLLGSKAGDELRIRVEVPNNEWDISGLWSDPCTLQLS